MTDSESDASVICSVSDASVNKNPVSFDQVSYQPVSKKPVCFAYTYPWKQLVMFKLVTENI